MNAAARRQEFAAEQARDLVAQLGRRVEPIGLRRGWTQRAVWYDSPDGLIAVVGDQEGNDANRVLAHGLVKAAGRPLTLVLPKEWARPTRFRQPWLSTELSIWTHSDGTARERKPRTKEHTAETAGGSKAPPPHVLSARAAAKVRPLIEWATAEDDLVEAHTSSARAWSVNGQKVLTIKGGRRVEIKAGIDAKTHRADVVCVDNAIDDDTLATIKWRVEQAMSHARKAEFGKFEEHHLQVVLRRFPGKLFLENPVLREVPAWRPMGGSIREHGRGFIDLVAMDGAGDVVLVETKLDSDEMLVLQGLDYWIWAQNENNAAWLRDRLHADPAAPMQLLYAVAGKGGHAPRLGPYCAAHLKALDPDVNWRFALIEGWNTGVAPQVTMLAPGQAPG